MKTLHYQVDGNHTCLFFFPWEDNLYAGVATAKGGVGFLIAITVSCHLWTVGVRSFALILKLGHQDLKLRTFPFWASLNVCFAIFKLPLLWPFRDGLSWQEGIDSSDKNLTLQYENPPHKHLLTFSHCCPTKAVLNKTSWNFQHYILCWYPSSCLDGTHCRMAF